MVFGRVGRALFLSAVVHSSVWPSHLSLFSYCSCMAQVHFAREYRDVYDVAFSKKGGGATQSAPPQ